MEAATLEACELVVQGHRELRGLTYLCNGQTYHSWVPKGRYNVAGVVKIAPSRANDEWHDAAKLVACGPGMANETWYIGVNVARKLIEARKAA